MHKHKCDVPVLDDSLRFDPLASEKAAASSLLEENVCSLYKILQVVLLLGGYVL